MKILAIDSSGMTASAAILDEEKIIAEFTVNNKKTHSQTLLPMIEEVCRMADTKPGELGAIAVAGGPGSFTGLRIGSATAKGMGLALSIPLVSVSTLEGLAYNGYGFSGIVCPMMDARRSQVYTALYRMNGENGRMETLEEPCALAVAEWIDRINEMGQPVLLLGDGADVYREVLEEKLQVSFLFAPAYMSRQRASAVGYAGMCYLREGKTETAAEHRPDYLRVSQAEREREERLGRANSTADAAE